MRLDPEPVPEALSKLYLIILKFHRSIIRTCIVLRQEFCSKSLMKARCLWSRIAIKLPETKCPGFLQCGGSQNGADIHASSAFLEFLLDIQVVL